MLKQNSSVCAPESAQIPQDVIARIDIRAKYHDNIIDKDFMRKFGSVCFDKSVVEYCNSKGYELTDTFGGNEKYPEDEWREIIALFERSGNSPINFLYIYGLAQPIIYGGFFRANGIFSKYKTNPDEIEQLKTAFYTNAYFELEKIVLDHIEDVKAGKTDMYIPDILKKRCTREVKKATIKQEMEDYDCNTSYADRQISKVEGELMAEFGSGELKDKNNNVVTMDEKIAEKMNCTVDNVKKHKEDAYARKLKYLDDYVGEDGTGETLGDAVEDKRYDDFQPEDKVMADEFSDLIFNAAKDVCDEFELKVLLLSSGYETGETLSTREVAKMLDTYQKKVHRALIAARKKVVGQIAKIYPQQRDLLAPYLSAQSIEDAMNALGVCN